MLHAKHFTSSGCPKLTLKCVENSADENLSAELVICITF